MCRYRWIWVSLSIALAGFGGCLCGPPLPRPDGGTWLDGHQTEPLEDSLIPQPDGGSERPDKRKGCPPSWTEKMTSEAGSTKLFAVFCPPPTITGCYQTHTGPNCAVAKTPLIRFSYDPATKSYEAEHSGSIEQPNAGTLVPGSDATKPDRLTKLPPNFKIRALFSGQPISFEFKGEEVTIFQPE